MALAHRWSTIRDVINDCRDHRVLDDEDVLRRGDETCCASTLIAGHEDWHVMTEKDFGDFFGRTVADMNNRAHNNEMDTEERFFRRKR